jgi:5'-nucleotidase (lipoprotein e(P4) family)
MKTSIIVFLVLLLSCTPQDNKPKKIKDNESIAIAVMYQQIASEYKALCYQAYNNAAFIISQNESINDKAAIVLDLDETVLDNTPFEVITLTENINYPDCWDEWCLRGHANLVPGVKEFLVLADSLGYEIFYVSNRKIHLLDATLENLKLHNLPNADSAFVLLRAKESDKDPRRDVITSKGYNIKMLIGDNLGDFSNEFQVDNNEMRDELVTQHKAKFGTDYIVLPNPMYGKWLENTKFYSVDNRDSLYKSILKGFECKRE